jgi:hypothetical protein
MVSKSVAIMCKLDTVYNHTLFFTMYNLANYSESEMMNGLRQLTLSWSLNPSWYDDSIPYTKSQL